MKLPVDIPVSVPAGTAVQVFKGPPPCGGHYWIFHRGAWWEADRSTHFAWAESIEWHIPIADSDPLVWSPQHHEFSDRMSNVAPVSALGYTVVDTTQWGE